LNPRLKAAHANSTRKQLKTITGCLSIVNVTSSTTGKNGTSPFEELDLTNLAKIDYDDALCGDIFALRIMRNKFLRRIDFNENLTLNGEKMGFNENEHSFLQGYFIRMNSAGGKIYFGGNPNTTFLWSDPKDCAQEDPVELLRNCTNLIGPVFLGNISPELNRRFTFELIKRIYGQLIIRSTNVDLDDYGYLTIIADHKDAVIIENNKDLRGITALTKMNITLSDKFPKEASENWKPVVVRNNGKICLKSRRDEENVRKRVSTLLQFSDFCRDRCAGGIVTDLTSLQSCRIVMGGLTIKDYDCE
uniref:Recep_L_domain domain-containing protein n=1 Tax=Haemonchus placei TaxID=6290 RepID=A0A158QR04_HAEPC